MSDELDMLYEQAALAAMDTESSPEERQRADDLSVRVQSRLAELRRNLVPAAAPLARARPVRASLSELGRTALLAKLAELTQRFGPTVRYAHRNLDGLSDDDLRRLVDTLEPD